MVEVVLAVAAGCAKTLCLFEFRVPTSSQMATSSFLEGQVAGTRSLPYKLLPFFIPGKKMSVGQQ
jgi:hypothetical protein